MRISRDGFIDVRDQRRVRTPGGPGGTVEPLPEAEALAFLLSHSFRGQRRIVRPLNVGERRMIHLAAWADSVSERMALVDRVWRAVTEPILTAASSTEPQLVQVVEFGPWAYPIHLAGDVTRVLPQGGVPAAKLEQAERRKALQLDRKTA